MAIRELGNAAGLSLACMGIPRGGEDLSRISPNQQICTLIFKSWVMKRGFPASQGNIASWN